MIKQIDHIVILVHDLEGAMGDYGELGFTVVPGGEHADGRSRNALIAFSDGSYLELIAFKDSLVPESHMFYRPGNPEGLVTFAVLPTDIESDVRAAHERGLELDGPRPGGRLRPDGQRLEWKTAAPTSHDLPFLCADVTPRELRVPEGSAHDHPNGATGISALGIVVSNLEESVRRYSALLGPDVPPGDPQETPEGKETTFRLGDALIVLAQPSGEGDPGKYLKERGEGPYLLAPSARPDIRPEVSDPAHTHGVLLALVSAPLKVGSVGEEYAYIAGLTCSKCGGRYNVVRQSLDAGRDRAPRDVIEIVCLSCGQSGSLYFDISSFFSKQI
jgi:hypothetical protein